MGWDMGYIWIINHKHPLVVSYSLLLNMANFFR